jgi:hypothetical protein
MSPKRVRFITVVGVLFAALVIGVSLLLSKLTLETRLIDLPETQAGATDTADSQSISPDEDFTRVEVKPDTVQAVVASLNRRAVIRGISG